MIVSRIWVCFFIFCIIGVIPAFADNMTVNEEFKEQTVYLIPSQESHFGMFVDNSTGLLTVDFGTVFTVAGTGPIPDFMAFDGRMISKDIISPVSLNGDWEYMSQHLMAVDLRAEGIHTIHLITNDEITHSFDFEVKQITEENQVSEITNLEEDVFLPLSPRKQIQNGVMPQEVQCKVDRILALKGDMPYCLKLGTVDKLVQYGWNIR